MRTLRRNVGRVWPVGITEAQWFHPMCAHCGSPTQQTRYADSWTGIAKIANR